MNNNFELDEWIEAKDERSVTHVMYHCFDEYEDEDGVVTASIKVKFKDGTESPWYHPPKPFVNQVDDSDYIFKVPSTTQYVKDF